MTEPSLYPIKHGDGGRGGAVEATTTAVGRVTGSVDLGSVNTPFWPADLLLWQGHVLVSTYDTIRLFDAVGNPLWDRPKARGVSPAVAPHGVLYFQNRDRFIDGVDLAGERVLKSAPFPHAMGERVTVETFWPRDTDFIATLFLTPGDDVRVRPGEPKDPPLKPGHITVLRNDYPTPYGTWSIGFDVAIDPTPRALLVPGSAVVALAPGGEVVRVAPTERAKAERSRFAAPVVKAVEWSVDADEVYAMTGYHEGRKVLVAFGADGAPRWRWEDHEDVDRWAPTQPPIRLRGGRVVVLTEGRVLAFDEGRPAWGYDLRSEMLRHGARIDDGSFEIRDGQLLSKSILRHGTGLADGSVLVTAGKSLFHLGADGKRIFSVAVDADILSTPVVDAEGAIYFTTATHLFKVR